MTELQKKIFGIMKVFDQVCRKNGLHYYMLGGTMLGAVRHKGFIPWDDDADFGLPRKEYERLLTVAGEALPEGYRLRHFSKENNVPYAFARLEDTRTTCIEARRSGTGYVGGVYIDIFPLDEDTNVSFLRLWKEWRIKIEKKLLYAHIAEPGVVRHPVKQMCMRQIVAHTKKEAVIRKLDYLVSAYGKRKEEIPKWGDARYSNYLGHWGRRESIPRCVFDGKTRQQKYFVWDFRRGEKVEAQPEGRGREYEFEGYCFFGPVDSEAYLTALYGADYRIPPEKAQRGGHPATVIKLEQPYCQESIADTENECQCRMEKEK